MTLQHGFTKTAWKHARKQARPLIRSGLTKPRLSRTYTEVASKVTAVTFTGPHDPRPGYLLGDISYREQEKGGYRWVAAPGGPPYSVDGYWEAALASPPGDRFPTDEECRSMKATRSTRRWRS